MSNSSAKRLIKDMTLEPQTISGICFRDPLNVAVTQFQILIKINMRWKKLQVCADSSVGFQHTAPRIKTAYMLNALQLLLEYVSRDWRGTAIIVTVMN
jgi:hypothetical protein